MAEWIYVSPHLDDAILSCGGMIWQQTQLGDHVEIWTVCAKENPYPELSPYAQALHDRWGTGDETVSIRRGEDKAACLISGAAFSHYSFYDCIYRRDDDGNPVVTCDIELVIPPENWELNEAKHILKPMLEKIPSTANIVGPLTMGGHRDHRLVRMLLEDTFPSIYYFADFPYIVQYDLDIAQWTEEMKVASQVSISPEGLQAWQNAISCYASQISSFWKDDQDMRKNLKAYWLTGEGSRLWGKEK
ncbi:MAG: PIG-L family deacetylase [Anaerolineaceae bacterium]